MSKPVAGLTVELKILRKTIEAKGVCSFQLIASDGRELPEFTAGSHIDVYLPNGLVRQYSLYGNPNDRTCYKIAVLKDPESRGGSRALHELCDEGQTLQVSLPKNHFSLAAPAKKSLLLAAGIGITPILSMAEALSNSGAIFELHYAARSPEQAAFYNYIGASKFAENSHFYFSESNANQRLDLHKLLSGADRECHVYICGPKRFIDAALSAARELGWASNQLHFELFGAELVKSDSDQTFAVKLASSGQIISVAPDQSVVEALSAAGIEVMVSCEQGVCGTCITGVLEGVPEHKDSYFTAEEQALNNQFTPCCSRSKTPLLVLDL